ncbi:MAG: hypothetical protein V1800_14215 [Candidatus Latescibacterota bacterium]
MYSVIYFDTEDYITPEREGIDDIPRWLAEILTEEGVPGCFHVIGEKARSLERRGRQDVIRAISQHDVSSHFDTGSMHPTTAEAVSGLGWEEGVAEAMRREGPGFRTIERIFGKCSALTRHGGTYAPQIVCAAGNFRKPYFYSPVSLPGHNITWFCGALNFTGLCEVLDDVFWSEEGFERRFASYRAKLEGMIGRTEYLAAIAGHPQRIRSLEFVDSLNYGGGRNVPAQDWRAPALRPMECLAEARQNFRRVVRYLRDLPGLEMTTVGALAERFSFQRERVSSEELRAVCQRIVDEGTVVFDDGFSAGELLLALAESVLSDAKTGALPEEVPRRSVLGPIEEPIETPQAHTLHRDEIVQGCAEVLRVSAESGHLPGNLVTSGAQVGLGSWYSLLATTYLACGEKIPNRVPVVAFPPYPTIADEVASEALLYRDWDIHGPDLDFSEILHHTRLQTWTVKPACECPGL